MKKLTPSEKRDVYTYCMLELTRRWNDEEKIVEHVCIVLCSWLYYVTGEYPYGNRWLEIFPEFLRQKPKSRNIEKEWWGSLRESGYNSRMQALAKAIELTYKKELVK